MFFFLFKKGELTKLWMTLCDVTAVPLPLPQLFFSILLRLESSLLQLDGGPGAGTFKPLLLSSQASLSDFSSLMVSLTALQWKTEGFGLVLENIMGWK